MAINWSCADFSLEKRGGGKKEENWVNNTLQHLIYFFKRKLINSQGVI
jgi:hypothetical protein